MARAIDEIAYEEQAGAILVGNPLLAEYVKLGPIDRLRELAQADKEGRCVVQRFSPGQTVWVIERNEYGEAYDLSGYVFVTSLRGIALVSPKINGSPEIDVILMDQVESRINYDDGCIVAYPADDCYLSREAAEQALGEDARRQEEKHSGY